MKGGAILSAGAVSVVGLVITSSRWPELHVIQVLLPYVFGLAAGILYGRGRGLRLFEARRADDTAT